ncbi:cupin domain-containing protein [Erwinia sp. BNK-24-b]|uniref:cupin domain-containing protein n=1 Tax=unclassified Erwinia TaxID=2622719 RepID=UPI0039BFF77B
MLQGLTINNLFTALTDTKNNSFPIHDFKSLPFKPYEVEGREGVSVFMLYDDKGSEGQGPSAALVNYVPGAKTPTHLHPGWELVLVLEGELIDDRGRHVAGVLQTYPPGSSHALSSELGCTFLVVWEKPVQPVSAYSSAISH